MFNGTKHAAEGLPDGAEEDAILTLGRRIRAARLRRNTTQEAMAERAGVTRKTFGDLEAGKPTVSLSILVKTMSILGYLDRVGNLVAANPIGEDIQATTGRKKAAGQAKPGDF